MQLFNLSMIILKRASPKRSVFVGISLATFFPSPVFLDKLLERILCSPTLRGAAKLIHVGIDVSRFVLNSFVTATGLEAVLAQMVSSRKERPNLRRPSRRRLFR